MESIVRIIFKIICFIASLITRQRKSNVTMRLLDWPLQLTQRIDKFIEENDFLSLLEHALIPETETPEALKEKD